MWSFLGRMSSDDIGWVQVSGRSNGLNLDCGILGTSPTDSDSLLSCPSAVLALWKTVISVFLFSFIYFLSFWSSPCPTQSLCPSHLLCLECSPKPPSLPCHPLNPNSAFKIQLNTQGNFSLFAHVPAYCISQVPAVMVSYVLNCIISYLI